MQPIGAQAPGLRRVIRQSGDIRRSTYRIHPRVNTWSSAKADKIY